MDSKKARKVLRGSVVGLAFASVLVLAQPAEAVSKAPSVAGTSTGCPGGVSLTQTSGYRDMWGNVVVQTAGPTVYRSPCFSGTQNVRVTHRLYRFQNGGWREDRAVWGDGGQYGINLPVNTSFRFSSWGPSLLQNTAYTITVFVEWRTSTGQPLGTYAGWFNSQGDYYCQLNNGCHRWQHPTLGAGVMICGPCYETTYLIT